MKSLPYAVRDVDIACATFMEEIVKATTVDECLHLREAIGQCVLKLAAMESSASDRAERLCGGK